MSSKESDTVKTDVASTSGKTEIESKNTNLKDKGTPLLTNGQLLVIAGVPISVLLAFIVQYFYHNFHVLPLAERTLLPQTKLEINRLAWRIVSPESIFHMGAHHPDALRFGVAWQYCTPDCSEVHYSKSSVASYQFEEGDGKSFGKLIVEDLNATFTIQYVVKAEIWSMRVYASAIPSRNTNSKYRIFVYATSQDSIINGSEDGLKLSGSNSLVGNYSLDFNSLGSTSLESSVLSFEDLTSLGNGDKTNEPARNRAASFVFNNEFGLEIAFRTEDHKSIVGDAFQEQYEVNKSKFLTRFEEAFDLKAKNMPEFYQAMGRSAMATLLSSVNYFYGTLNATGLYNKQYKLTSMEVLSLPVSPETLEVTLNDQLCNMLTMAYLDAEYLVEVLKSQLNSMNSQGSMPAVVHGKQLDYSINPDPTIFLALDTIMEKTGITPFKEVYPKIEKMARRMIGYYGFHRENIYTWGNSTQNVIKGQLAKAADVDLHCWMVVTSRVMKKLSSFGEDGFFVRWNAAIDNVDFLNTNYLDNDINLFRSKAYDSQKKTETFVETSASVSLFPLMFKLVPANSPQLTKMLELLSAEEGLWSNFGVRSMGWSGSSQEESGDVSIASNYLLLSALKNYSDTSSENQAAAHGTYSRLRNNIIANVAREYKRTKMLWQVYSSVDGKGKGARSHSHSSLILNIIAEVF